MQVENLKNVQEEKVKYLRIATVSAKAALSFFYIGTNPKSIDLLSSSFEAGFTAKSLEASKNEFRSASAKNIDVIVIDVPYKEREIRDFKFFLTNRGLTHIPVIYSAENLQDVLSLKESNLVDDVIDLHNWQYEFSSKIRFLKKAKAYGVDSKKLNLKVNPSTSIPKRVFDVVVASLLALLLLPLFVLIAIAIRMESKGPIFYNSKRAGRGFRVFKFYKFRTMEVNADKKVDALTHLNQYTSKNQAKFFKISNDPRITKVGRFLRNTSLDELPQLLNVIIGDMSLVGNRPLPLYEAATLTTNESVERFMAPAGITGLWQIKKRGKADMSVEERINLDISYARNSTLLFDFWIMANTPGALFQKTDV